MKMCIIARADMDETEIIDVIHPHDLPLYMAEAHKMLGGKLQARIDEQADRSKMVGELQQVHKEGQYFGVEITIKFDDGEYPWIWREFYHYTIKEVWQP